MKTNSRRNALAILAFVLSMTTTLAVASAQTGATAPASPAIPSTVSPAPSPQTALEPGTAKPSVDSDPMKEVLSADSVLNKLKQNTEPVTINDMIAAQDVLTRLDLISQIESKMAKIDDDRMKRLQSTTAVGSSTGLGSSSAASTFNNAAAMYALQQAGSMPSLSSYTSNGSPQILAITGTEGSYSALLQVGSNQLNVNNGGTIPGLGVVSSITPKEVEVTKPNGKTVKLTFTQS